jgi:transcriptional regulator with XRE-family HTH domain
MLAQLRATRENAGLTQYDLARLLGRSQSYVGKCELGERRLDLVQLRDFCRAMNVPFLSFVQQFEAAIDKADIATPPSEEK